jgi:hypothetical protein
MTMALCLNCGGLKFGALCPCPACEAASTGNQELDIAFSDHVYSDQMLAELGAVIKVLQAHCDNPQERFWAFLYYVVQNHPTMLKIQFEPTMKQRVKTILDSIQLPRVTTKFSWRSPLRKPDKRA